MAVRLSTGMRNAMLDGLKSNMNGGVIRLYSGAQPASADYEETGTLLAIVTESSGTGGLDMGTAASGVLPKDATVWSGVGLADGVASWFRFYGSAGTSGSSASEKRIDGNAGVSGSDITLKNTSITPGQTVTVDAMNITQPAQA